VTEKFKEFKLLCKKAVRDIFLWILLIFLEYYFTAETRRITPRTAEFSLRFSASLGVEKYFRKY